MSRRWWSGLPLAVIVLVAAVGFAVDDDPRARPAALFLVERPTLGARVGAVTDEARREHGLTTKRGALVVEVVAGGTLDKAGIAPGAVVVAVDGHRIDTPQELSDLVRGLRGGQDLELTYYEGEQLRRKRVRLGSTQESPAVDEGAPAPQRRGPERVFADRPAPERAGPERGPALKRLERVIDNLIQPPGETRDPAAAVPRAGESADDLRAEVAELRAEVVLLRRRLAELERILDVRRAQPGDAGADDADDVRPQLVEPDAPPPRREPKLQLGPPKLEPPQR